MFIAALSTIFKIWNQHRCQSTDVWIKKNLYIYTIVYYSPILWKMDGTRDHHVKWNKPDSERQISHVLSDRRNLSLNNDCKIGSLWWWVPA
jgi:hypothetical protein